MNRGYSVTQRTKNVKQPMKQPRGGYINPKELQTESLGPGIETLNPAENVSPNLVGLAVDYLTRFMSGASSPEAFEISLRGAHNLGEDVLAAKLLAKVKGLDDISITNAIKLTTEGIIPALESSHALAQAIKMVPEMDPDQIVMVNLSGRGDKDVNQVAAYLGEEI